MAISNSTDRLNGLVAGLAVKAPCRTVTTVEIELEGLQTINGVALAAGDRVLVKDQSDASENGIYNASTSTWQRAADFDGNRDVVDGTLIIVDEVGIFQVETAADPVVIGTSELTIGLKFVADSLVTSVFGRTGDVIALQADYDAFFLTQTEGDARYALLAHTHVEDDITDLGDYLENVVEDLTPELGGDLAASGNNILMGGGEVRNPFVSDYEIKHQTLSGTGSVDWDYADGQSAEITLTGDVTLSISNAPTSGRYGELQVLIVQDSTARTITWPSSFQWPDGVEPDISVASSVHVVHAFTIDGGTTWYATHASSFS